MKRTRALLDCLKRARFLSAQFRMKGRSDWPTRSGSRMSRDIFEMVASRLNSVSEALAIKAAQRRGVAKTPRIFEIALEKRADDASPPLLLVITMAEEIVVGRTAKYRNPDMISLGIQESKTKRNPSMRAGARRKLAVWQ